MVPVARRFQQVSWKLVNIHTHYYSEHDTVYSETNWGMCWNNMTFSLHKPTATVSSVFRNNLCSWMNLLLSWCAVRLCILHVLAHCLACRVVWSSQCQTPRCWSPANSPPWYWKTDYISLNYGDKSSVPGKKGFSQHILCLTYILLTKHQRCNSMNAKKSNAGTSICTDHAVNQGP